MLFNREPQTGATQLRHTTLATSRLLLLFVAAKIWRHAGRTGVSYSDRYVRRIAACGQGYSPAIGSGVALKKIEDLLGYRRLHLRATNA